MNADWHRKHVLGKKVTTAQRLDWHREHQKHCGCRPPPASLAALVTARGDIQPPSDVERKFAAVVASFADSTQVTRGGKGFGATALKVHGKIFAMVSSKGLFVVKLPSMRVTELAKAGRGEPFDPGRGKRMKEWLAMSGGTIKFWTALAQEAVGFVGGGPQPTHAGKVG